MAPAMPNTWGTAMNFRHLIAAGAALATLAAASAAGAATVVTFDLGATGDFTTASSYSYPGSPAGNVGLIVAGETYGFDPNGLTGKHTTSEFTSSTILRDTTGVGVCNSGETTQDAAPCSTVDTAQPTGRTTDANEALSLAFDQTVKLLSITISQFQTDSTLGLWSVGTGGALTQVYSQNPITGVSPLTLDLSSLDFTGNGWALTAFGGKDNGYHVNQVVVQFGSDVTSSAPEPAAWGLMIVGFAGLGAAVRSRRQKPVAA